MEGAISIFCPHSGSPCTYLKICLGVLCPSSLPPHPLWVPCEHLWSGIIENILKTPGFRDCYIRWKDNCDVERIIWDGPHRQTDRQIVRERKTLEEKLFCYFFGNLVGVSLKAKESEHFYATTFKHDLWTKKPLTFSVNISPALINVIIDPEVLQLLWTVSFFHSMTS